MKYVSIDIETGGLDRRCSILEFGAVIDDLDCLKPVNKLPQFHRYVKPQAGKRVIGEPYALAMHQQIFDRIAKAAAGYDYCYSNTLERDFTVFLLENGYRKKDGLAIEINVAGKNFAMFDKDFLDRCFLGRNIKYHRRVIDPAIFYFEPATDETLPASNECMKRAGLEGEVAHTAVEDAKMVVKLVRRGLKRQGKLPKDSPE